MRSGRDSSNAETNVQHSPFLLIPFPPGCTGPSFTGLASVCTVCWTSKPNIYKRLIHWSAVETCVHVLARPADVHGCSSLTDVWAVEIQFQHSKNSRRKKKGKPMHFHHEFHRYYYTHLFPRGVDINSSIEILMWPA